MPFIAVSQYHAPFWLPGGHSQTIFPSLFRKVREPVLRCERISTPDDDFLDLDLHCSPCPPSGAMPPVVILSHGLEGNSRRAYMLGMCRACVATGWDCVARNFRSCGGEMNLGPSMYHSGETEDLHTVVQYCLSLGYRRILLVGFSMGGNQTLMYLGREAKRVPGNIVAAAVFSVPCDLPGSAAKLDLPGNSIYLRYFLKSLRNKVRIKHSDYPELYPLEGLDSLRTFAEFDARYTAPVHGFFSAQEYWRKAATLCHLGSIRVPALLVNARNDPFLSPGCYPEIFARQSSIFFLETPEQGGHVGFSSSFGADAYWSEHRAVAFFSAMLERL